MHNVWKRNWGRLTAESLQSGSSELLEGVHLLKDLSSSVYLHTAAVLVPDLKDDSGREKDFGSVRMFLFGKRLNTLS